MQLPTEMSQRGKQNLTAITPAKDVKDRDPINWHDPEKPETLSDIEARPPKSFHERMRKDPAFRHYVEEHQ